MQGFAAVYIWPRPLTKNVRHLCTFADLFSSKRLSKWGTYVLNQIGVSASLADAPSAAELAVMHAKACFVRHAASVLSSTRKGNLTKTLSAADDDCDAGVMCLKEVFEDVWGRTPLAQRDLFDARVRFRHRSGSGGGGGAMNTDSAALPHTSWCPLGSLTACNLSHPASSRSTNRSGRVGKQ